MATSLKPLLHPPVAIGYPVKDYDGKTLGEQREWSISPICGCFNMQDTGLNCCCAHCCAGWYTYGQTLHYVGLGSLANTLSAGLATQDFGDSEFANAAEAAARLNAAIRQQEQRRKLIRALGLRREGDEGFLIRCCCMPCVQCQEVDTIFVFYRDSLGYRDIQYGDCFRCQCTRFYSAMGSTGFSQLPDAKRVVPFPDEIYAGESIGPNYDATDLPNGWEFVGGVPKQREKAPAAPQPGYMQRDSRVK